MMLPTFEPYAIRYDTNAARTRGHNYIPADRPDAVEPMDYFSWVAIGPGDPVVDPTQKDGLCSLSPEKTSAVTDLGVAEAKRSGAALVARMKQMPLENDVYDGASIRQDGRVVSPAYLFVVKTPAESTVG